VTGTCETTGERLVKYEPLVPCVGVPDAMKEKCSDVEVGAPLYRTTFLISPSLLFSIAVGRYAGE
jgi:hypothetical protein